MAEAEHDQLWKVTKKHNGDFEPYGRRSREDDNAHDCSCGCKYYHRLEGPRGADWGVCFNYISRRAGMITFEHQGCIYFEQEEDDG